MSTLFTDSFVKINQISPLEHDFTEVLESIALTPKTLYFRGKLPQNMSKNGKITRPKVVAIVGSRHNTKYGEEVAYRLAYELARHGVIVISGLAYGIDSIGHRGCLAGGGTTIAVLGTPIDKIYPSRHEALAREIIEKGGAIISEYGPSTDGATASNIDYRLSFLYRNRLISGLSDTVVVVEAAERSGTLNTAAHALSQGRDVFAVPGNITSPYSRGCNKLIREGAFPYTSPDDVLYSLFPEEYIKNRKHLHKNNLIGDNDVESMILQALANGFISGDEIMKSTSLPPEVFGSAVSLLEIKGRISALGANNWALNA